MKRLVRTIIFIIIKILLIQSSLRLEWGIGKYENSSLSLASGFCAMIENEQYSFNEFKEELQKLEQQ